METIAEIFFFFFFFGDGIYYLWCVLFNIKGNQILASKKGLQCFFLDITLSLELQ